MKRFFFLFFFNLTICFSQVPNSSDFLRVKDNLLQTSVIELKSSSLQHTILLVAAVHIGEKKYYEELTEILGKSDVVFFEGIIPGETARKKEKPKAQNLIQENSLEIESLNNIYKKYADEMKLEQQTNSISLQKNWVHADITLDELNSMMKKKEITKADWDEFNAMESLEEQEIPEDIPSADAKTNSEIIIRLRKITAAKLLKAIHALNGSPKKAEKVIETVYYYRNEVAISKIDPFLKHQTKVPEKYSIFYGAAHMPHFLKTLTETYGYQITDVSWVTVWSLSP